MTDRAAKFVVADVGLDAALQLQEVSTLLIREGEYDALYERVLDTAIMLMSADMASMQAFSAESRELRLLAFRGFHPESAAFWRTVRVDSACSCGLAMCAGARIVVPDIEACDAMVGTGDLDASRRSNIRAVQSTPLMSRSGQLLGMISTHWRDPHQPPEHSLRLLDVLARQAADLIEGIKTQEALRETEERSRWLAAIVESSDDAIVSKNLEGVIQSWNRGAERIFGYSAKEVIGKSILILIPLERHHEEPAILERMRRGERIEHYETVRRRKDGSLIDVSLTVSPVRSGDGKIIGASKIARDITERKRSEAHIAILAREAEHRSRNILATVAATVQLSQADTPAGLKSAIEGRIRALANAHALFVESRWAGASLQSLVRQEMSPYSRDGENRAQITGPEILLEPSLAQCIAIALHELATNAAKYGGLSVPQGRVHIAWWRLATGQLVIRWVETDGPPVEQPKRTGFGTRVMQATLKQLNGEIRFNWHSHGLTCEITLPLSSNHVS